MSAVSGCFDSHGMPFTGDAGPPRPDAGMCMVLPGSPMDLRCELRGDVGHAIVSTAPTRCCGSGTPTTSIESHSTSTGEAHAISVSWEACECCDTCRCIGPVEEIDVSLGALTPGVHAVTFGSLSCRIDYFPPTSTCSPGAADDAHFPHFVYDDQSFAATTIAPSGGCGCSPRFDAVSPSSIDLASISLCDCCDVCDCIDFGYELNIDLGPLPLGEHPVTFPHGAGTVSVVARADAHPIDAPTSLRIVSPDGMHGTTGPRIDWAVVGGTETVCCVSPAPIVDRGVGPDGEIVLTVASATASDCECVGAPVAYETWFPLIELGSGVHTVRLGAMTATLEVP